MRTGRIVAATSALFSVLLLGGACGSSEDAPATHKDASVDQPVTDAASDATDGPKADSNPGCSIHDPDAATVDCFASETSGQPILQDLVFALTAIYVENGRDGVKDPDIWKKIGRDIDGVTSDAASTEHCKLAAGADAAKVKPDGDNGIDNGLLHNVAPIIAGASKTWAEGWNKSNARGGATILIRLPGIALPAPGATGTPGTGQALQGMGYSSVGDCTDLTPVDGGDAGGGDAGAFVPRKVAIDRASVCDGDLAAPLWTSTSGTFTGDVWDSGSVPEAFFSLPINGHPLVMRMRNVRFSMTLSADRRHATNGTLSGVIDPEEMITSLEFIRGVLLPCSTPGCVPTLCGPLGPTLLKGYEDRMRATVDMMRDGTQDPTQTCNGVSAGIGFDADLVEITSLTAIPVPKDSCAQ